MDEECTSAVVQRYLDALAGDAPAEPIIRLLLDRAVCRLHQLCASVLYRGYPRLTRAPLNLQADEMLGALVERLLKALREARPATVRMAWKLRGGREMGLPVQYRVQVYKRLKSSAQTAGFPQTQPNPSPPRP